MRRALAAMATLLALALAACGGHHGRPPCPAGEQCLLIGNGAEPLSLDPAKIDGVWEGAIVDQLIVGLTDRDAAAPGLRGRPPGLQRGRRDPAG